MRHNIIIICLLSVLIPVSLAVQEASGIARGVYFAKAKMETAPLPDYPAAKPQLPVPILDDHPEYLELYWKAWELTFANMKRPLPGSPLVSNYLDEAISADIYQWDTTFMILFARYAHPVFPAIESFDNFYCRQHDSGYISRVINETDGRDMPHPGEPYGIHPPLFSWVELEWHRTTGDASRFAQIIPVLAQYVAWMEMHRVKSSAVHGLFWNTVPGSGMDNSPRLGSGWVDMSAQMVMMYDHLATMCRAVGLKGDAGRYRRRAAEIGAKINHYMWDEADGLYYDLDDDGSRISCPALACLWPLTAGICTPLQAARLSEALQDTNRFRRKMPLASLSAHHRSFSPLGDRWLGGVWAPTNYMIIRGLQQNGFHDPARHLAEEYLRGIAKVYRQTGSIWEYYAPDRYAPGISARPDFVGSGGLGPIAMLLETFIGIQADAVSNLITWRLHRIERHGVENFRCGPATVSMVCKARKWPSERALVRLQSDSPIRIEFVHPLGNKTVRIKPGIVEVAVPE